jgi:hypothetical protein
VETPGTEVIASMAGGRKTMGALLYGAMTLVGREFDMVTHVLVSEPFDSPALQPRFYYPEQPSQELRNTDGSLVIACEAVIDLAEVPFVPLRNAFAKELGQMPESFTQMVRKYRREVKALTIKFHLRLHRSCSVLEINGERYKLAPKEHVLMHYLVGRLLAGDSVLERYGAAHDGLIELGEEFYQKRPMGNLDDWRYEARFPKHFEPEDIRKLVNQLKTKLRKLGPVARGFADLLPSRGRFGLHLEQDRVKIIS